ncbi:MAG: hypothetical protein EHM58_00050 [Ignavibacteriae bacterium]|nr:MAG: hypothetical protein EHM58_00050 [Ignavibacteriota bacterium]
MKELPKGWKWVRLGDVSDNVLKVKKFEKKKGNFIYLDIGSINNKTHKLISHKEYDWTQAPSRAQQIIRVGDILFSTVRTYLKNTAKVDNPIYNDQIASTGFAVIRPLKERVVDKYIFYYSISNIFVESLNKLQTGSSYPAVRDSDVFNQMIPICEIAEQRRITDKIEELFSELDEGIENLKKAQAQLKIFRQAVLKYAFEGRLTNKNVKDGELPEGWKWVKVNDISNKITDGEHLRPNIIDDGIPFLSAKDVRDHDVVFDECLYISKEDSIKFRKRCNPEKGDILIVSRGATVGRSCIVKSTQVFCLLGSVILIKPKVCVEALYLSYLMKSPFILNKLILLSGSTAQQAIYLRDIKNILVPICPKEEQIRIVNEIESRLSVCDSIEKEITQGLNQSEHLRQSILKQAFGGRL